MASYALFRRKPIETSPEIRDIHFLERPEQPLIRPHLPTEKLITTPSQPGQNPPTRTRKLLGINTRKFI